MEFKKLEELQIEIIDGDRGKKYPNGDDFKKDKYCLFLNAKNVTINGFNFSETMFIDKDKDTILRKGKLNRDDIVLTTRGTVGNVAYYSRDIIYENVRINSGMVILRCDKNSILPEYLYYVLKSSFLQKQINNIKSGSAQPQLPISTLKNLKINFLNITLQKKVIKILNTIDKKIELNNKINDNLFDLGDALYKELYENKDKITNDWKICKLIDVAENYDAKRKPMSSREREEHQGKYPYYGATSIIDYVEDYIFDGTYLLMGEDGTVVTDDNKPVLQYIWGKNWVNNHAHILRGTKISTEHLMFCLRNTNVRDIITGAVQPKINQENMNNIKIIFGNKETNQIFENTINSLMKQYKNNIEENKRLTNLRDTLLPKLMNGEINLDNIKL